MSDSERLPEVWVNPQEDLQACLKTIDQIQQYQARNWAIGLNGDTLQPDGFLRFFRARELPFKYYVRSSISLGEPSAYEANIKVLQQYMEKVRSQEIEACNNVITGLKDYKAKNWAIGLNGDTCQPDNFLTFFGDRSLQFDYYVQSSCASLGSPNAYEENIKTLKKYVESLPAGLVAA